MMKKPTEEAYEELQHAYDFYNQALFDGQLPPCLITLQRQKRTFSYYSRRRFIRRDGRQTDEIALNPEYFAVIPMIEVLQSLVHEMVHLWQNHFGHPSRACYHNSEWADKLESLGLVPSDTGEPGGNRTGQTMSEFVVAGGRFEFVTQRLLADGFEISWLDRFPAQPPSRPAWPLSLIQANEPQPGHWLEMAQDEEEREEHEVALRAMAEACIPLNKSHRELQLETREDENRSHRDKYTCPACEMNVWGKPGLFVKCGLCDLAMPASKSRH